MGVIVLIIGSFLLLILITVVPIIVGIPWNANDVSRGRVSKIAYSYVMGCFVMLSFFEVVFFAASVLTITLRTSVIVYSVVLFLLVAISLLYSRKKELFNGILVSDELKWTIYDKIYLIVFLFLLAYQLYFAISYSRTYMADDGYVAFSSGAVADNYINMTRMGTGEHIYHGVQWIQRSIQSFNYVPAYLSCISGINAAIISHTVIYAVVVVAAYMVYIVIADQLFKKRDNRLIFLSFISVLYIWGYHSRFSLTFRLLGPNDSGKAVLAVVLAPFMMVMMYSIIREGYSHRSGLQIFVLSVAACALTLGGIYTFAALVLALILISSIRNKSFKPMLYLLWGSLVPLAFATLYLCYRYV